MIHKLDHVSAQMEYIRRLVKWEGILSLNGRDRYELCGNELTSSTELEILIYDDFYERNVWFPSVIEHDGHDYYFVAKPELELEGMRARVRSRE